MKSIIRHIDRRLRSKLGITEFRDEPDCIFRVRVCEAYRDLDLPDGIVRKGEPVVEIHFWNEHLPSIGEDGFNLKWAQSFRRKLFRTHRMLAEDLVSNPAWTGVRAFGLTTALFDMHPESTSQRKWDILGYTMFEHENPAGRWPEFWERVWSWMLWHAYQSGTRAIPATPFAVRRTDVWISARELKRRYSPGPSVDDHDG